jgi:hypothetical protein
MRSDTAKGLVLRLSWPRFRRPYRTNTHKKTFLSEPKHPVGTGFLAKLEGKGLGVRKHCGRLLW